VCEYGRLKPIKVISRKGVGEEGFKGGDEPNHGTIYVHMEMSQ
jgi:hypothetical protein